MRRSFFPYFIKIRKADMVAQSDYKWEERQQNIENMENLYKEITEAGDCLSIKELAVNGTDLIALGLKPGKEIGELLQELLDMVLGSPELNNREALLEIVKKRLDEEKRLIFFSM